MQLSRLEYYPQLGQLSIRLLNGDKYHRYMYKDGDTPTEDELPFIAAIVNTVTKNEECPAHKVVFDIKSGSIRIDKKELNEEELFNYPQEVQDFAIAILTFEDPVTLGSPAELKALAKLVDEPDSQVEVEEEKEVLEPEVVDSKVIMRRRLRKRKVVVTDTFPVFDEEGNPVMLEPEPKLDAEGRPIKRLVSEAVEVEGIVVAPAVYEDVMEPAKQQFIEIPRIKKGKKVSEQAKARLAELREAARIAIIIVQEPRINRNAVPALPRLDPTATPEPTPRVTTVDLIQDISSLIIGNIVFNIGAGLFAYSYQRKIIATTDPMFADLMGKGELTMHAATTEGDATSLGTITYNYDDDNRVHFVIGATNE